MIRPLGILLTDPLRARNCRSCCGRSLLVTTYTALDLRPLYILVLFLGRRRLPMAIDGVVVILMPTMPLVIRRSFIAWVKVDTVVGHCLSCMGKGVW